MLSRSLKRRRTCDSQSWLLIIGMVIGFFTTSMFLNFDGDSSKSGATPEHRRDEGFHMFEKTYMADELKYKVRVLCLILTTPRNHEKRAKHVKATWGKRCNKLIFASSQKDDSLPTIALPGRDGRNGLWYKTRDAFKYIYRNHFHEANWFLKADDDTYMVLENVRYMLSSYNPNDPWYFGCRFKPNVTSATTGLKQGWMTGGAGYILSHEALRRFATRNLKRSADCDRTGGAVEDIHMGFCMEMLNVAIGDSRDSLGRGRFFQLTPEHFLIPGYINNYPWYKNYTYYDLKAGMECCSDSAISFHYIKPNEMYVLEFLIYHLKPHGISFNSEDTTQLTRISSKSRSNH